MNQIAAASGNPLFESGLQGLGINQVERFFALLTERQLRRGVHRSVADLHQAIERFIEHHNASPKPFRWFKSADDILASIERFCTFNTPRDGLV